MRHTVVYDRKEDWEVPVKAAMRQFGQFENLFKNLGDVADGFPRTVDLSELENRDEYDPHMLHRNLLFGTPDEVIEKLRAYDAARRRSFHVLRESRSRDEGAEAVAGAVHQGGDAGVRVRMARRPARFRDDEGKPMTRHVEVARDGAVLESQARTSPGSTPSTTR